MAEFQPRHLKNLVKNSGSTYRKKHSNVANAIEPNEVNWYHLNGKNYLMASSNGFVLTLEAGHNNLNLFFLLFKKKTRHLCLGVGQSKGKSEIIKKI
ncbi:hypothetical protein BpHYR1_027333 [Brachionus plicatilis]|uniref:Uncharacterized protein n=1 Tax=Brachionus plicatilis TaxID=10195 RepID=A0A3M7SXQ9_BRAPC|nr:hypothetical protein BpHYR1_027333 [Brachionus plicatilis]